MIGIYKKIRYLETNVKKEEAYIKRMNADTVIKTELYINPFSNHREVRDTEKKYELFYLPIQKILNKKDQIYMNSKKIMELQSSLSNLVISRTVFNNIVEEIQSTNEIEGVRSTRKEIIESVDKPKDRFYGIIKLYINLNKKEFQKIKSIEEIRKIYDILFINEIEEKPDGEFFRKDPVQITDGSMNKVIHRGNPDEESIINDLRSLIGFMNDKSIPFIEKCLITHYFFEYIHPFYDGNGRMGRFILSSYLSRKVDIFTGVSISNAISTYKKIYYKSFQEASHPNNMGEMTFFILENMDLIISGQKKSISDLEEVRVKWNMANDYLSKLKIKYNERDSKKVLKTIIESYLFSLPDFEYSLNIKEIINEVDLSRYIVKNILIGLEKDGLIKIDREKKPFKYKLTDEVIEIINQI